MTSGGGQKSRPEGPVRWGFGHPLTIAGGRIFHRDLQSLTSVDPDPATQQILLVAPTHPPQPRASSGYPLCKHHAQS